MQAYRSWHRVKLGVLFLTVWLSWLGGSAITIAHADPNPTSNANANANVNAHVVAYVKTVTGDAWVIANGSVTKAAAGVAIAKGNRLKTGSDASLGVSFIDNTVMSFGSDTELVVDEYLYAPNQSQFGLSVNLVKGTLNYVSGLIAKLKPESVTIKTPTGIIGVRGTQFVVRVEE